MSTYPPDGWSAAVGTWGTDMDRNTSVTFLGANSVEFKNTATASVELLSDYIPVAAGGTYLLNAWWRTAASGTVSVGVSWYNSAKTSVGSAAQGGIPTVGSWTEYRTIRVAPSTAAYARVRAVRTTPSITAYCAWAGIQLHKPMFRAWLGSNQSVSHATLTKLQLNQEDFDYGANFDKTTNYRFIAPYDCVVAVTGAVSFDTVTGNGFVSIYKNGVEAARGTRPYASGHDLNSTVATILELSGGDYLELYGLQRHGSARNAQAGTALTYMTGHEIS